MRGKTAAGRIRRPVLIVDDEPVNREILGLILGDDYVISYAENGQEALLRIREAAGMVAMSKVLSSFSVERLCDIYYQYFCSIFCCFNCC